MERLSLFSRLIPWLTGVVCLMILSGLATAATGPISYQGRLTDSTGIAIEDGTYTVVFAIYADSAGGAHLWLESATVTTSDGLFTHLLGSSAPLPPTLFADDDRVYLQISVDGQTLYPRTRIAIAPYAATAAGLAVRDADDSLAILTHADSHQVTLFDFDGTPALILRGGVVGDEAAVFPDSAVSSLEILDEAGIAVDKNSSLVYLTTTSMTDMVTVEITIPTGGYIVLHGKCYLLLSGTTGPNTALVQIDENEGGGTSFPYYTKAGLGGYVNTETNYFPVYVTRTYYRLAGTYTFRMEGKASNSLPAEAKSWDHILTAVFYATSYEAVKIITSDPGDHPHAIPLIMNDSTHPGRSGTYYELDLRHYERQSKAAENKGSGSDRSSDD